MKSEKRVAQEVEKVLCGFGSNIRLWNNPVGQGLSGNIPSRERMEAYRKLIGPLPSMFDASKKTSDYDVVFNSNRLQYGLKRGSADRIGIIKVKITNEMVGKEVGIFFSAEIKREGWRPPKNSRHHEEQVAWLNQVESLGGCGIIINSVGQAMDKVKNFVFELKKPLLKKNKKS